MCACDPHVYNPRAYVDIYMHAYIYGHVYIYVYVYAHTHVYVCVYVYVYTYIYMYIYINLNIYSDITGIDVHMCTSESNRFAGLNSGFHC